MPRLFALPTILLTLACSSTSVLIDHHERAELISAQQRWQSYHFNNYSIEMRSGCFCPTELNEWARVQVVNGFVTQVTILSTQEVIADTRLSMWHSVDDLFADLLTAGESEEIADITFAIDPTWSFPSKVTWKERINVADAGGTREMRNLVPVTHDP